MTLKIAKTAGFCYGVRRAMELALDAVHHHPNHIVYTWGPLVHNRQAVDLLKARGILPTENLAELNKSLVLIRAHGISSGEKKSLCERTGNIIDATCPHVRRAQRIAEDFSSQGYTVIIIGDAGHPEVTGILGHIQEGKGYVVENPDQVDHLPPEIEKVCIVAQTTQSGERFEPIVDRIKKRYSNTRVFNTVCGATAQRQQEIKELAKEVDVMIVIGGYHSANTARLAEISRECDIPTIHIETAGQLSFDMVSAYKTIGVTAGASTPHWVIRNVVERLREFERMRLPRAVRYIIRSARFLIYSQIYLALGAAGVSLAVQILFQIPIQANLIFLSALYVLSMHILNRYMSLPSHEDLLYGMLKYFARHKQLMRFMWIISGTCALILSAIINILTFILVLLSMILGALYSFAIIPHGWLPGLRYRRLMDIPGSKDLFMASAWAVVTVGIPFLSQQEVVHHLAFFLSLIIVLILVLSRSLLHDIRDLEGDIMLGRETIPLLLGLRNTYRIISILQAVLLIIFIGGWLSGIFSAFSLLMLVIIVYSTLSCYTKWQTELTQSIAYDALIDGQFILAGLLSLLWLAFH